MSQSSNLTPPSRVEEDEHDLHLNGGPRPSRAAGVHESIREEGETELKRAVSALFWSALAAGLSMSFSMLAKGLLHARLPDSDIGYLVASLGYTIGFLVVILARQQLFTENTVTAVLPVMSTPRIMQFLKLLRLWGVVLIGNLVGVAVSAYAILYMPLFDAETHKAFLSLGHHIMENTGGQMFAKGIIAGWMIATMVWLLPAAGGAKIWVILIVTYLVALGGFTHIIVGSTEVMYLMFAGQASLGEYLFHFALPTLAGNVIGGTFIFALISHAQVRSDT
ncbi:MULTISPECIES: formate/nitrite transporter family protein [Chromohalobacter]|uniref:Formate transporter n=2 Tax=Chromohalobacter TaxID=42054 RepID=A0A1Q8TD76_9GAMM|nr:formate/nitrite transporter family protein [Chromohalobacter japonicus]MCK0751920.1 formate/nitrite transporter family protein [Chromohalobacter japonicus]MCK0765260.1 formate/nitrite transporter family protein [Chromohalobacter beijerinckii]OLO11637.1 formate transporter [Chromohalobacter japonicus]